MNSALDRSVFRWVILASATASFLIALVSFVTLNRQTSEIADREIEVAAARAEALGNYLPSTILSRTVDWATWDQVSIFMDRQEPRFAQLNFNQASLEPIGVDDVLLIRPDGTVAADFLTTPVPGERREWLELAQIPNFVRDPIMTGSAHTGFLMIAGKLHIVAVAPIKLIGAKGSPKGTILMGRQVSPIELAGVLQMPVAIKAGAQRTSAILGDQALVHIPLPTFPGTRGVSLELNVPLTATKAARWTQVAIPLALMALTLMASALVFLVVNRLVTRRITRLDAELRELTDLQSIHRLEDESGDDEIASLRLRINALIDHVDAMNADERRLRKQALFALNDARRAEKAKSNFVAITSHEVRNPLAAVVGGIDVLLALKLPQQIEPIVQRLERSANRLKDIVNDVLDYTNIEKGSVPLQSEIVDLVQLAKELVESCQPQATEKNLILAFTSEIPSATVNADKFRIEQILSNLIDNALKFTHQGAIAVRLSLVGAGRWRFEVKDTGIGISPALSDKLFDPYFQADQSTVRRSGGTGLGLAICRRLVTAMHGRIWVESEPGAGATFFVELPLETENNIRLVPEEIRQSRASIRGKAKPLSLLLIEDNELVNAMMRDQITLLGHRVEAVSNGLAALNAVSARKYDAVLMDMHMPVMDGITATHSIRALGDDRADVPIIAITADAAASRRQLYEGNDFYAFLTKPTDANTLQRVLSTIQPEKSADPSPSTRATLPLIASEKIFELEHSMGVTKLAKHLGRFARDLQPAGQQLLELSRNNDSHALAEAAHSLFGSALLLGAVQLQDRLNAVKELEQAADPRQVMDALSATLADTLVAVEGLLDSMMDNRRPAVVTTA